MSQILVTGINGFIGLKIATNLLKYNHEIIGVDIKSNYINELKDYRNFKFYHVDITNSNTFPQGLGQIDVLIHCAAIVPSNKYVLIRENYFKVNVEGTKNILSFIKDKKVQHIIFLSTVSVYGQVQNNIIPDENTQALPVEDYAESKLAAENEIIEFSNEKTMPYTIFRLAPVYGPNFMDNVIKRIILPGKMSFYKFSLGNQQISLCSVKNVVQIIDYSIMNKKFLNQLFIVKDSKDYSINEIISIFRESISVLVKIVVVIPSFMIKLFMIFISLILKQKKEYFIYQLKKITADNVYSSEKLNSTGIHLLWDLKNSLN